MYKKQAFSMFLRQHFICLLADILKKPFNVIVNVEINKKNNRSDISERLN